jgi:hypothetical protein
VGAHDGYECYWFVLVEGCVASRLRNEEPWTYYYRKTIEIVGLRNLTGDGNGQVNKDSAFERESAS